jgi:hypothetical protein
LEADSLGEVRTVKRAANLEIADKARDLGFSADVPFVCECRDASCQGFARLPLDAFEVVATQSPWSIIGDAHGVRAAVIEYATDRTVVELVPRAA